MNAIAARTVRSLVLAAAALSLHAAHAQSDQPIGKAAIPFDFEWNGEHIAAGTYSLYRMGPSVRVFNGKQSYLLLSHDEYQRNLSEDSRLVFHCYSGRCFLHEIRMSNSHTLLSFVPSKAEKVARQQTIAQNNAGTNGNTEIAF